MGVVGLLRGQDFRCIGRRQRPFVISEQEPRQADMHDPGESNGRNAAQDNQHEAFGYKPFARVASVHLNALADENYQHASADDAPDDCCDGLGIKASALLHSFTSYFSAGQLYLCLISFLSPRWHKLDFADCELSFISFEARKNSFKEIYNFCSKQEPE